MILKIPMEADRRKIMKNKIEISGFADEIAEDLETQISVVKKLGISYIEMRCKRKAFGRT